MRGAVIVGTACVTTLYLALIASVPDSPCSAETAVSYIERFRLRKDRELIGGVGRAPMPY